MKKHISTSMIALLLTPLLTQCVIEEGAAPYESTPHVSGSPKHTQCLYERREHGAKGGERGLSRKPSRHKGQYDSAESDAFHMGYEKGYNRGIR